MLFGLYKESVNVELVEFSCANITKSLKAELIPVKIQLKIFF